MSATVTFTIDHRGNLSKLSILTIEWTADTDGTIPETSFPTTVTDKIDGFYANLAITIPSQISPPTDQYDIEILDENNIDIYQERLKNRSNTTPEQTLPQILTNVLGPRLVSGPLVFKLTNNLVNSASGTLKIYFIK
jgi:hypothetical protein